MDWNEFRKKFLSVSVGQEVPYRPDEIAGLQAVFELTETIRPRRIAAVRSRIGEDLLVSGLWDRRQDLFQMRARLRDVNGRKEVLRPTPWMDVKQMDSVSQSLIAQLQAGLGAVTVLEFGREDTVDQIVAKMVSSSLFNVVMLNPDEGTVTRLA